MSLLNGLEMAAPDMLARLKSSGEADAGLRQKKIEKAAQQFEALFVLELLKNMRASFASEDKGESFGKDVFMSIADQAFADKIAETGSLGIAEMLMEKFSRIEGIEYPTNGDVDSVDKTEGLDRTGYKRLRESDRLSELSSLRFRSKARFPSEEQVAQWVETAATKYEIPSGLIKAVIQVESAGNQYAVSHRGAKGMMQLMDSTASDMGVENVFDPKQNIEGGSRYLSGLLDKYSGDLRLALAAYNAGPGAVDRYGDVPPYSETVQYVDKVIDIMDRFNLKSSE